MSDKETAPWIRKAAKRIAKLQEMGLERSLELRESAIWQIIAVECTAPAPQPAERSDKDYAIEHAEYLAKAAEHLMDEINKYDMAESTDEEGDCDARSDAWNSLRSAIGEFRKRAKRAAATPQVTPTPDFPAILERERTLVDEGVTNVKKAIQCREWLTEGRGSYEWNDDRWHGEFAAAIAEILTAIQPLERIAADWTNCPQKWEDVQKAREELKGKPWSIEGTSEQASPTPELCPSCFTSLRYSPSGPWEPGWKVCPNPWHSSASTPKSML